MTCKGSLVRAQLFPPTIHTSKSLIYRDKDVCIFIFARIRYTSYGVPVYTLKSWCLHASLLITKHLRTPETSAFRKHPYIFSKSRGNRSSRCSTKTRNSHSDFDTSYSTEYQISTQKKLSTASPKHRRGYYINSRRKDYALWYKTSRVRIELRINY